jgi:hypothetical protein
VLRVWEEEWRDREFVLAIQVERNTAGYQGSHRRRVAEQGFQDTRARIDDLLEIVQHDEELLLAQVLQKAVERRASCIGPGAKDCRDLLRHELVIGQGGEVDKEHPVAKSGEALRRNLQPEPRFTRAARTGQGDDTVCGQQLRDPRDLVLSADEPGQLRRQIVGPRVERPRRREVLIQGLDDELMQAFRLQEVLQAVLAEVA